MSLSSRESFRAQRSITLAISKIVLLFSAQLLFVHSAPLQILSSIYTTEEEAKSPDDASLWIYLGVAAALVLLGGAFAGLTIALMGQDEMYLQVIRTSGEGAERKHAEKVLRLLNRGKHWVLVTLLLSNVITNETLPIVLDRSLGGGWPAVLGSTVLIVIFGEIAPQSVCVRFGLPIGAWMSPFVLMLMYLLSPIAWPTAKLLDYLLGEEHGTVYKKAGLKTLVSLHRTMGEAGQQLNTDEVTIISAVLDLKEKSVGDIMTRMDDVFVLSVDDILDEETIDEILAMGYSRIPVHASDNPNNFVGMLLVKMLITYDPEDAKPVKDFSLATLPETRPETSCLDIINFFQEGKSHMVLVSDNPGGDSGALGVATLEDVIEELIGEEIIDESDVFIDVHKAIRRMTPAPRARYREPRVPKGKVVTDTADNQGQGQEGTLADTRERPDELVRAQTTDAPPIRSRNSLTEHASPRGTTFMLRRRSSTQASSDKAASQLRIKAHTAEMKEHLSHLGPSNVASRPRSTRYQNVKIKPGLSADGATRASSIGFITPSRRTSDALPSEYSGGIGEGLMSSAGLEASDGVQALHTGYGTMSNHESPNQQRGEEARSMFQSPDLPTITEPDAGGTKATEAEPEDRPELSRTGSGGSHSTIRSLQDRRNGDKSPGYQVRGPARSGSITENVIDVNGIRKVVLEMTSSSESNSNDGEDGTKSPPQPDAGNDQGGANGNVSGKNDDSMALRGGPSDAESSQAKSKSSKKKRRKRKKGGKGDEHQPLLG